MEITMIGPDIAKRVFQAHGVDAAGRAAGRAVLRRKLRRAEVLAFFQNLAPCWSASRHAGPRITGHARSGRWAARCG